MNRFNSVVMKDTEVMSEDISEKPLKQMTTQIVIAEEDKVLKSLNKRNILQTLQLPNSSE